MPKTVAISFLVALEGSRFPKMATRLAELQGKFILSLNDHKQLWKIFGRFQIRALKTKYSSMNGRHWARRMVRQKLLTSNY